MSQQVNIEGNSRNFKGTSLIVRLKDVVLSLRDGTHGSFQRVEFGRPLLSAKNIKGGRLIVSDSESYISEIDNAEVTKNGAFRAGDVLLTIVGTLGGVACLEVDGLAFQRSVASIRPSKDIDGRYLYWCLTDVSTLDQINSRVKTTAQSGLYLGEVRQLQILMRSKEEQIAIADSLDKMTAIIDKQRVLLERKKALLQEHKKALIHEAVTKGLTPGVAMKPSGVDRIGDVPCDWRVSRVKDLMNIRGGGTPSAEHIFAQDECINGVPWATPSDYQDDICDISKTQRVISIEGWNLIGKSFASENALLVSCRAPIGKIGYVKNGVSFNQGCKALQVNHAILDSRFAHYSLIASVKKMHELGRGTTFQEISSTNLGRVEVALPPLREQYEIAEYLDKVSSSISRAQELLERKITLLRDIRFSLIHEAVTQGVPASVDQSLSRA